MRRRQYLAALSLATVAAAGCTAPGESTETPPPQSVSVNFSNESGRTLVFTAAVVEDGLGGVRITYRDDSETTYESAQTVDDLPAEAWDGAVTFTPLADHQRRRFRSTDGSGAGIQFDPVSYGSTVVTTVADPNREDSMLSLGAGTCGEVDEAHVDVRVDAEGMVHLASTCADEIEGAA